AQQVGDRVQVLRHQLVVLDADAELLLQEADQFQYAGRIENTLLQERLLARQQTTLAEEAVIVDELAQLLLACIHARSLDSQVANTPARAQALPASRRPLMNSSMTSCVDSTPTRAMLSLTPIVW